MAPERIVIGTLRSHLARGFGIWASCSHDLSCTHCAELDLATLIRHFGADFDLVANRARLVAALRCSRCGRTRPEIRLYTARSATAASGSHGHSATRGGPGFDMDAFLERERAWRAAHPAQPTLHGRPKPRRR